MVWFYRRADLRRALILCAIVGSWLVSLNQGSEILAESMSAILYVRIFLDYATPFTVSSLTSMMRNRSDRHHAEKKTDVTTPQI